MFNVGFLGVSCIACRSVCVCVCVYVGVSVCMFVCVCVGLVWA